jgi:hypothetical protein
MDLVRDVYNRLHSRDEMVFCPSCRRILYIPEDLTVEKAVHKPKERRERLQKAPPAAVGRQTSAVDVLRSIEVESEETTEAPASEPPGKDAGEAGSSQATNAPEQSPAEQPPAGQN